MKLLYSSSDIRSTEFVKSVLDGAGIEYQVKNETIPYPITIFYPEVWIFEDSEFARASELIKAAAAVPTMQPSSWTCPSCGEQLEGQFGSCWKCGANRDV